MENEEESYYLRNLLDPQLWFKVANGLVENSKELEPKVYKFFDAAHEAMEAAKESDGNDLRPIPSDRVLGVYFMLMAFAVEDMFKGIIIQHNYEQLAEEARTRKRIPGIINSHDLVSLSEKANISISAEEEELLLRLKDNLTWRGRYPTPLTENGLNSVPLKNGEFASQAHYSKGDIDAINALIEKVQQAA